MTLKAYTSRAGAVRGRTRPLLLRILSADSTADLFVPVDGLRATIYAVDPDTGMADGKVTFEELTTRGTVTPYAPPRVMIAPSGGGLFEVRVIGVGGWRTTHHGDLSSCRSDARAMAQVLGVTVEDDNG